MRYRIEWNTNIVDVNEFHGWLVGAVAPVLPVSGHLILEADSLEEAREIAEESLVDVDFFAPRMNVSASDRRVIDGEMEATLDGTTRRGNYLGDVLPTVDEWTFDTIKITEVTPA